MGVPVVIGGDNLPSPVGIGSTDLLNIWRGASGPPGPPPGLGITGTMVNGTLLNFSKRYKDDLRVIFDQWPKLHLGLDALSK